MILAIDTSTRAISIALADETGLRGEHTWVSQNHHTTELAPAVSDMLAKASAAVSHITAIAVAIGPGSFTAVRIGVAFAKGLAMSCRAQTVGVRTHDIAVAPLPAQYRSAVAVVQAGRKRAIWVRYQPAATRWLAVERDTGTVGSWAQLAESLQSGDAVIGEIDAEGETILRAVRGDIAIAEPALNVRQARHLASIGLERLRLGQGTAAAALAPLYAHSPTSEEI